MNTKISHTGPEFQREAKKFVINMESEARMLHIKNTDSDFDSYDEAKNSGIDFLVCRKCFRE